MSIAAILWQQVKYLPKGRPFSSRRFAGLGSRSAVGKAIAQLVRASELERITRGIYMRPKTSPYIGSVRPSTLAVIRVIAKQNHETIQVHGAEAVREYLDGAAGCVVQDPQLGTGHALRQTESLFAGADGTLVAMGMRESTWPQDGRGAAPRPCPTIEGVLDHRLRGPALRIVGWTPRSHRERCGRSLSRARRRSPATLSDASVGTARVPRRPAG